MTDTTNNSSSLSPDYLGHADALAVRMQDSLLLIGRVLMGWIFLMSGWRKLMDIPGFVETMPRRGLPEFLGYIAPFVEFIGGALLILGLGTRYALVLLMVFLLFATFSSHRYWTYPPEQQANQSSHFWKNVAMMGGVVALFVTGAGRHALDRVLRRRA